MALFVHLPRITVFLLFFLTSIVVSPFGPMLVLVQLALVGVLAICYRQQAFETLARWWPLMALPLVAFFSGLWSIEPAASFRYGFLFLIAVFTAILLAKTVSPRDYLVSAMFGLLCYCLLAIVDGTQGPSQQGMVLVGFSGSKNMLGTVGSLTLLSGLATLLMGRNHPAVTASAALASVIGVYLVDETNSSGAVMAAAIGSCLLLGFKLLERFTSSVRVGALLMLAAVCTPLTLLAPEAREWSDRFLYETLNKDRTLSGRQEIWAYADELIERKPIAGYGFAALRSADSAETIAFLRMTGRADMRGFNFHDSFRQFRVDMGAIGFLAFTGTMLAIGAAALLNILRRPSSAASYFYVLFMLLSMRSSTEVFLGGIGTITFLFYAAGVYAIQDLGSVRASVVQGRALRPA